MYICVCARIYIYIYIHICLCVCVCLNNPRNIFTVHTYIYAYIQKHRPSSPWVNTRLPLYIHPHIHKYTYIHTYIQEHRPSSPWLNTRLPLYSRNIPETVSKSESWQQILAVCLLSQMGKATDNASPAKIHISPAKSVSVQNNVTSPRPAGGSPTLAQTQNVSTIDTDRCDKLIRKAHDQMRFVA